MVLSEAMKEALRCQLRAIPDSIHEEDREPERWTRGTPKRTCEALVKRGLADDFWWDRIGNYRAHLTDEGLRMRHALFAERADILDAIRKVASR